MRTRQAPPSKLAIVFDLVDLLQDMAIRAGDADLATDLNVALVKALYRHLDATTPELVPSEPPQSSEDAA